MNQIEVRKTVQRKIKSLKNQIERIRAKERSRILASLGIPRKYHSSCSITYGRGYAHLYYEISGDLLEFKIKKNKKQIIDSLIELDIPRGS